jgi:DNA repair protein RadC
LLKHGEHKLSDTELLAVLLRSGSKGQSAIDLARKIIQKFKTFRDMSHTDARDWQEFKGLGQAKIAQIKAAIEIGRRFLVQAKDPKDKVTNVKDIVSIYIGRMRDLKKEVFKVLLLDNRNYIISNIEITEGTVTLAHPIIREIISRSLQAFASSIVCVHNHPSGNCMPSKADRDFTRKLHHACEIMHIKLMDHIIIGNNSYYSFADRGELE